MILFWWSSIQIHDLRIANLIGERILAERLRQESEQISPQLDPLFGNYLHGSHLNTQSRTFDRGFGALIIA